MRKRRFGSGIPIEILNKRPLEKEAFFILQIPDFH